MARRPPPLGSSSGGASCVQNVPLTVRKPHRFLREATVDNWHMNCSQPSLLLLMMMMMVMVMMPSVTLPIYVKGVSRESGDGPLSIEGRLMGPNNRVV